MTTTISETNQRYSTFYYLDSIEHLALGQAASVVANGRKYMESNTIVVNYARSADKTRWFVQVGIATGNTSSKKASEVWPAWTNPNSTVFEVVWVTKIVEVPAEMFANQRNSLPLADCPAIVNFALQQV